MHNPLIPQRADPHMSRHGDYYYFTASVPLYDRIELRRATTIEGLVDAPTVDVWHKPETGPYSNLIWAPEFHRIGDLWVVYFAAAHSREIKDNLFQHRMWAITCADADPLTGKWSEPVQVVTPIDAFCLDATSFVHRGVTWYLYAQKDPAITGNSNLYLAPLKDATTLAGAPVMLSKPELDWEIQGFWVNEGPSVLIRNGRVFISYSASATDERYAMGLLWADENADLMDPASWTKSQEPVFKTNYELEVYGPGYNSFVVAEDGKTDLLVYHARNYTEIEGDPLWNPDRHCCVQPLGWDKDGMPVFGLPLR